MLLVGNHISYTVARKWQNQFLAPGGEEHRGTLLFSSSSHNNATPLSSIKKKIVTTALKYFNRDQNHQRSRRGYIRLNLF